MQSIFFKNGKLFSILNDVDELLESLIIENCLIGGYHYTKHKINNDTVLYFFSIKGDSK
jgi:hypothetical protein